MLSITLIIWEKEDVRFDLVCENETSRSVDNRTVRARQGLNIEKRAIHRMTLFSISLRARDGIRTRDPRLGKAILHH